MISCFLTRGSIIPIPFCVIWMMKIWQCLWCNTIIKHSIASQKCQIHADPFVIFRNIIWVFHPTFFYLWHYTQHIVTTWWLRWDCHMIQSPAPWSPYNKNPYPLRNHVISNEATVGAQEPQGLAADVAPWFLGSQQLSSWELRDFSMGTGSCFYSMIHRNEAHWVLENHAFPNTPFLHWFWQRSIAICTTLPEYY